MLLRALLEFVFIALVVRTCWRVAQGIVRGFVAPDRPAAAPPPDRAVRMRRDPVCGTFVVPDDELSVADRGSRVFFCSVRCRDQYRARIA